MIRWIIWLSPLVLLLGTLVYKINHNLPPSWWTVLLAVLAGVNVAVGIAQMLIKKLDQIETDIETMINEVKKDGDR